MYKILLADDEGIVLDSLRFIIDKHFGGMCEVRTAKTGRMAVEVAQEFSPDIALLDIQMPGLNGIDAMKEIRTFQKQTVFVVISAYDRFDYAKTAISLGAKEYILKPFSKEKVVSALRGAMNAIQEEREKRSRDLIVREKLQSVVPVIENGFMNLMLLQQDSAGELEHYRQLLDLEEEYGIVMAMQFGERGRKEELGNPVGSSMKLQGSMMRIRGLIREFFPNAIVSSLLANRVLLFLPRKEQSLEAKERSHMIEQARNLVSELQRKTHLQYRVGIGEVCPIADMRKSCLQAQKAMSMSKERIAHIQDAENGSSLWQEEGRQGPAEQFIDWMTDTYGECPQDVRERVRELVTAAGQSGFMEEKKPRQNHPVIERAKAYIEERFDKELSLEEVAKHVDISPYYFSKLFKEEEGRNFVEYVTELRMEKAKRLLKGQDASIKEVCISVGYGDPNYFSRIFKKSTGYTPTEYREGKSE